MSEATIPMAFRFGTGGTLPALSRFSSSRDHPHVPNELEIHSLRHMARVPVVEAHGVGVATRRPDEDDVAGEDALAPKRNDHPPGFPAVHTDPTFDAHLLARMPS